MPPPLFSAADEAAMREALAGAEHAVGLSDPNPRVGCVLVGRPPGTAGTAGWRSAGHTQAVGEAHAEVMALRAARAAGHDTRGATAYVTLEPCAHHGRTPPCCDALIEAGIARVVIATGDPNPLVGGQGIARLAAGGVRVELGLLEAAAREINIGFLSRMRRGRPWVRLKAAASLDGRTALDNGASQWITGPAARADGHAFRKRAGAVLTGIGTVRDDDPRLDVRLVATARQPLRVLVDSHLQVGPAARLLQPPGAVLVYAAEPAGTTEAVELAARRAALPATVEVALLPATADGKTDLGALLADLAARGVNELHVEAGHRLNASLLHAGLVDELLVYLAPRLIGPGHGIASLGPIERLADALAFEFIDAERIGDDLRLRARPPGRADF